MYGEWRQGQTMVEHQLVLGFSDCSQLHSSSSIYLHCLDFAELEQWKVEVFVWRL